MQLSDLKTIIIRRLELTTGHANYRNERSVLKFEYHKGWEHQLRLKECLCGITKGGEDKSAKGVYKILVIM